MLCLVNTRLERWSRQVDVPFAALVAALAIGLFSASWAILHVGFFTHHQVKDTPLYLRYGNQIVDGEVPYRDVQLEYPPASLPFFVVPAIGHPAQDTFDRRFEWMMLFCGGAMVALMAGGPPPPRAAPAPVAAPPPPPPAAPPPLLTRGPLPSRPARR